MANNIKGITIEIGGTTQKLDQALKDNEKTAKSLQNELKAVNAALKLDPTNIEAAQKKQELLTEAVENTKEKLNTLKEAQEKAKEAFDKGEMSAEQYRAIETEVINTENELKRLEDELKNVHGAADAVGAKFEDIGKKVSNVGDKISSAGDKISNVGQSLMPVTAAITAIGAASVSSLMEMDEGYDTVIKKTGATGEALEDLTEQVDDVFSSLPTTAADAGIAVGEVNTRFGLMGDACEELSKDFIRFAEINETDLNTAIDSVDAIMTKFGIDTEDATAVLGLMTKAAQDTGITIETLENALSVNGATLKEMGLDLTESVNLLAQFEMSGVDTTTALAGLKKAQQNATEEGKTLEDALSETIESIKNASSETEALQIATELFGKKGAAEMTQAIREGRFSLEDLTGSLSDYGSIVEDTFNATISPWDEAKVAVNNLKVAGADLANELFTMLQPIISGIVEKVKEFTSWFKNLNDGTKQMIIKIAALVAALSPALMIIGKLTSGIGGFVTKIGGLITKIGGVIPKLGGLKGAITAIASPVGIVVAAIGALVAAFVYLYNTNDEFREKVNNAVEQIKAAFQSLVEKIKPLLEDIKAVFESLMTALQPVFEFIVEQVMVVANGIMNAMQPVIDAITNAINFVINIINAVLALIRGDFDGFFSYISAALQSAIDFVTNTLNAIAAFLSTLFSGIWTTITGIFQSVGQWFCDRFNEAYTGICNIFSAIGEWFAARWSDIKNALATVAEWFGTMFADAVTGIENAFSTIGQWFSARWMSIKNIFSTVATFFQEKFNSAAQAVKNAFSAIPQFFSDLWAKITGIFIDAGQKVADGVMGAFKSACNAVFGTIEGIVNGFVSAINGAIGLINKIPGVNIGKLSELTLPRLAKGGVMRRGQAIVGEEGAELLTMTGSRTIVTPLSDQNRSDTLSAAGAKTGGGFVQNITIESPKALSPYEVARQTRNQTRNMVLQLQGAR